MPNFDVPLNFHARVIIPTTTEPVSIIGIEETVGGFSTICINRTSEQAAIAQKYKAFVKPPTGLINRLFDREPYPIYRMDISDPITAGFSWQLAALIAHALRADGNRLAFEPQAGSALIWATGEVKSDLSVAQVGNVGDKLRISKRLFEQALTEGRPLFVFIPAENEPDIDPDVGQWLEEHGVRIHLVADLNPVFAALSLPGISLAASKPAAPKPEFSGNPYRGLEAYQREHRELFFGRGRAREEALDQLRTAAGHGRAFLLVHGQSGVGKSSLVQAGLAGDIEEQAVEGGLFRTAIVTPSAGGDDPLKVLCHALRQLLDAPFPVASAVSAQDELALLIGALRDQSKVGPTRKSGLIIIDQLEEIFDPGIKPAAVKSFGDAVETIVATRLVWVVATIRSDALGQLDRSPALARLANNERIYRLDRPSRYELSEIITAPLALAGRSFADRLIPEQFADVAAQSPDSLPLLQAVLYRFYEQGGSHNQLTAEALRYIGGFEGAVGVWAEEVRGKMIADGIAVEDIDRVVASLVRIDPESRRPLSRSISYLKDAPSEAGPQVRALILNTLVQARLASTFVGADGPRVRLAHEILTIHWAYLAALADRLSAAMLMRDDLEQRASTWLASGKDDAELLRGTTKLDSARSFVRDGLLSFDEMVKELVEHSVRADEKSAQEKRRLIRIVRGSIVAACILLVASSVMGVISLLQQSRLQASEHERKVVTSVAEATRAKGELEKGMISSAVGRLVHSFGRDADVPFVPTAYEVLFKAANLPAERSVFLTKGNLSTSVNEPPVFDLADGSVAAISEREVRIWSPMDGIVAIRRLGMADYMNSRVLSPSRRTFYMTQEGAILRYQAENKRWTTIDLSADGIATGDFAAPDDTTLFTCRLVGADNGTVLELARLDLTGEDGKAKVMSSVRARGCRAVYRAGDRYYVVIGERRFAEFDPATLKTVREFDRPSNDETILRLSSQGGYVLAHYVQHSVAVYKPGVLTEIARFAPDTIISDDGRWAVSSKGDQLQFLDLSGRQQTEVTCESCYMVGFDADGRFLYRHRLAVYAIRPERPQEREKVVDLPESVDRPLLSVLGSGKAIMASFANQPSVYLPLNRTATLENGGISLPKGSDMGFAAAFSKNRVVVISQKGLSWTAQAFELLPNEAPKELWSVPLKMETFYDEVNERAKFRLLPQDLLAIESRRYESSYPVLEAIDLNAGRAVEVDEKAIAAHDTATAAPVADMSIDGLIAFKGKDGKQHELSFDPIAVSRTAYASRRELFFAVLQSGQMFAWDLKADWAPMINVEAQNSVIKGLSVSAAEDAFVTWDDRGNIRRWDLPEFRELLRLSAEAYKSGTSKP